MLSWTSLDYLKLWSVLMPSKISKLISTTVFAALIGYLVMGIPLKLGAQGTHSITLSWTAPSPVGGSGTIAHYNVKRSTATGTETTVSSPVASPYIDTTGVAGTKYFYVVSTVDSAGNESPNSIEVSAIAIGNPNPPQGVTVVAQ
jgi:hypothetical protein